MLKNKILNVDGTNWLVREAASKESAEDAISMARVTGSIGGKDSVTGTDDVVTVLADVVRLNDDGTECLPYGEKGGADHSALVASASEPADRTSMYLAAETALTSAERARFIGLFDTTQSGASIADILDTMDKMGAHSGVVEVMHEAHDKDVPEPGLLAAAARLAFHLYPNEVSTNAIEKTWEVTYALIERIRPLLGMDKWELRDERMKRDKLELLAPLGFVDTEDGEFTDGIYHPMVGTMNHNYVRLDNVIDLVFAAGMKRGAADLRAQFRALLDVPPTQKPE